MTNSIYMEPRRNDAPAESDILIYQLPLPSSELHQILVETDIRINQRLLTEQGEPAFPFPLTLWQHENEI